MNMDAITCTRDGVNITLDVGHVVVDSEQQQHQQNNAIVVNMPPIRIDEWNVNDRTVADDNPSYDPSEHVVIVVYESALQEHYSEFNGGGGAIKISELSRNNVPYYAFPKSRLNVIGSKTPPVVELASITPSPYHSRSFSYEENKEFIADIRETGWIDPRPIVVPTDNGYELVNGHKRVWAGHVAGIQATQCHVAYFSPKTKARKWAKWHLPDYTPAQQDHALQEMKNRLDTPLSDVLLDETVAEITVDIP